VGNMVCTPVVSTAFICLNAVRSKTADGSACTALRLAEFRRARLAMRRCRQGQGTRGGSGSWDLRRPMVIGAETPCKSQNGGPACASCALWGWYCSLGLTADPVPPRFLPLESCPDVRLTFCSIPVPHFRLLISGLRARHATPLALQGSIHHEAFLSAIRPTHRPRCTANTSSLRPHSGYR
jgi:hypothetical protein